MNTLAIASVFAFLTSVAAGATTADVEQQVIRADRAWAEAEVRGDVAALHRILDERFTIVYDSGKVVDRETFIKELIGDGSEKLLSSDFSNVSVHVAGDTAILIENDTLHGTSHGKPFTAALRLAATYIKRDGRWVALLETVAQASAPVCPPGPKPLN